MKKILLFLSLIIFSANSFGQDISSLPYWKFIAKKSRTLTNDSIPIYRGGKYYKIPYSTSYIDSIAALYIRQDGTSPATTGYISIGTGNGLVNGANGSAITLGSSTILDGPNIQLNAVSKKYSFIGNSGFTGTLDFTGVSDSSKTYQLPNKSGKIALLSDITSSSGFIKIDGTSGPTTGNIQLGDGFGFASQSGNFIIPDNTSGIMQLSSNANKFQFIGATKNTIIDLSDVTTNYTAKMPPKTGTQTIAMTSDLTPIQDTTINHSVLNLASFGVSGAIGTAAATVNTHSRININQNAYGITLTVPNPSYTATKNNEIVISNTGTAPLFLSPYGPINAASSMTIKWTGTAWIKQAMSNDLQGYQLDTTNYGPIVAGLSSFMYGNSICFGTGTTSAAYTYVNRFGVSTGNAIVNRGIPGSSLVQIVPGDSSMINRIASIPTYNGLVNKWLTFEYGVNDANSVSYDSTTFKSTYNTIIDAATTKGWPAGRIVLTVPYTSNVKSKKVYATVKTVALGKGCRYADAYERMTSQDTRRLMTSDSIHPNNFGHEVIGQAMLDACSNGYKMAPTIHGGLNVVGALNIGSGVIGAGSGGGAQPLRINAPTIISNNLTVRGTYTGLGSGQFGQGISGALATPSFLEAGNNNYANAVLNGSNLKIYAYSGTGLGIETVNGLGIYSSVAGKITSFQPHYFKGLIDVTGTITATGNADLGNTLSGAQTTPNFVKCGFNSYSSGVANGSNLKMYIYSNTGLGIETANGLCLYSGAVQRITSFQDHYFKTHICGGGSTPTIAAGTGAGTGPTVAVTGTDMAGYISVTTGTIPTLSAVVSTITFNVAYNSAPRCIQLTPAGPNAALLSGVNMVYVDQAGITTTTFAITSGTTALTAATTYKWYYSVIQ